MKQTRLTIVRITSNLADLMSATVPRDAGQYRYAAENPVKSERDEKRPSANYTDFVEKKIRPQPF